MKHEKELKQQIKRREEELKEQIKLLREELRDIRNTKFTLLRDYLKEHGPMLYDDAFQKFGFEGTRQYLYIRFKQYGIHLMLDFHKERWIAHEDNLPKPKWR